ncbi:MAG: hypothetical protein WDW36_003274 [Sanguina aurantia]
MDTATEPAAGLTAAAVKLPPAQEAGAGYRAGASSMLEPTEDDSRSLSRPGSSSFGRDSRPAAVRVGGA